MRKFKRVVNLFEKSKILSRKMTLDEKIKMKLN